MVVRPTVTSLAYGLQDARVLGRPESPMHLQAHKPQPPVDEPTPEPDERAPVEEPDRPDPRSPPERPRR
jgi:hypothetical protein